MNHKFAVFYVTVISVALVGSLSASHLNQTWKHVVFTFPPEAQKVVENGTATMEVKWRWLPETLEMMVKVNDDDFDNKTCCDEIELLFDSDNNGNLTSNKPGQHWSYFSEDINDHGIFFPYYNGSYAVLEKCFVLYDTDNYYTGYSGAVQFFRCRCLDCWKRYLLVVFNGSCIYREGEGYTFKLSIPIEHINVKPPTPIHIAFTDQSFVYQTPRPLDSSHYVIFAEFTG